MLYEWHQKILQITHLSTDALSIYLGLILFFFVAFCHHRQLKSPYAIWTVVVVAVGLELFNARHDILDRGYWRIGQSLQHILNVLLLPLILWLMARYRVWKG
ncbi:hypothetical protein [Acinetobacter sp. YH01005]|uniref:hypothetical protein n=1 Tax=Acinetobacter sp. YH01005 TaxID=2601021 RepID=UPI00211DBE5D|nr:hypothetical protein [Acinetobacter sp. YH01005]